MAEISDSLVTRLYYQVKPFVPRSVRWALRRNRAVGIRERFSDVWPINESAAKLPADWKGWPDGKRFALVLTHDIESADGVEKVKALAELELKHGLHSSFNFIPEGGYLVPDDLREWLVERGFEVGVHDLYHDGKLYSSRRAFKSKAQLINRYLRKWGASGFRSGFMLRELDWLHDLEVVYDASTFDTDPFEPQSEGCRSIFPYFVPNPHKNDGSGYMELPYTLPQDSTLYLLLRERSPEIWLRKLDWIVQHGGMVLVNIHPDYMDFEKSDFSSLRYPMSLVEELLDYVSTRYRDEFWNPLPKDLAVWFRQSLNEGKSLPGVVANPSDCPHQP